MIAAVLAAVAPAFAQSVPDCITYQGKLTNSGVPVPDGTYQVTFKFYDSLNGGMLLWTSAASNVMTTAGCFTTVIQSIPSTVLQVAMSGLRLW